MKTLVLNCGSSSLKFQLIDVDREECIAKGLVEKIGAGNAVFNYQAFDKNPLREVMDIKNHEVALKILVNTLTDKTVGVLRDITEIDAFGHRVVHGGERFSGSVLITPEVIHELQECSKFAPLHNPANLMGIHACSEAVPGIEQVGVFDTAFHSKIPKHAFLYGLPYAIYEKLRIRRYGFHGTSHWYVSQKAAQALNRDYQNFKVIVCHLGNGSSICAVKDGVSVDTSMGFTPLEGLMMGTRCGDIDPAIVPYLMEKKHLSSEEVDNLMNKLSGLKGVSTTTNDMRDLEEAANAGSKLHQLALEMFCYRIKKYIGAYMAALGGIDALVFTAGIGENSATVRRLSCAGLEDLGIVLDEPKNQTRGTTLISAGAIPVLVVPTNEELAIAKETNRVIHELERKRAEEKESAEVETLLHRLTDSNKARIAILWSQHQELPIEELVGLIRDEMDIEIATNALTILLARIGVERTAPQHELSLKHFAAGDVIYQEGDPADEVYVLKDGEVELRRSGYSSESLGPEAIFGELAIVDGTKRCHAAAASTDCELKVLDRKELMIRVRENPHFAVQMVQALSRHIRERNGQGVSL